MRLSSASYAMPIAVSVWSAVSNCPLNSNRDAPSAFLRLGKFSNFYIWPLQLRVTFQSSHTMFPSLLGNPH